MYPLSHIYVSSRVMGTMDSSLALGSVLPDILVGSGIGWRDAHRSTAPSFRQHLISPFLRLGAALHGIDLPGLDYFSDVSYENGKGYAYQKALFIEQDIIQLGVKPEHALWRGHNFIEMAVEVLLNRDHYELWHYLAQGQHDQDLHNQVIQLARSLEASNPEAVQMVLERFLSIRGIQKSLAHDYAQKLNSIYGLTVTPELCEAIIAKSVAIIDADYREFLDSSIDIIQQSVSVDSSDQY